jgi:anion-transporting  ArsA/GET3 family ATPase
VANSLLDRRLLLFTGKGGVGKTTVVSALMAQLCTQA